MSLKTISAIISEDMHLRKKNLNLTLQRCFRMVCLLTVFMIYGLFLVFKLEHLLSETLIRFSIIKIDFFIGKIEQKRQLV